MLIGLIVPQNRPVESCCFGYMAISLLALQIGFEHCIGWFWPVALLHCLAELLFPSIFNQWTAFNSKSRRVSDPWSQRWYLCSKHQEPIISLLSITTQKTRILKVNTVVNSNLASWWSFELYKVQGISSHSAFLMAIQEELCPMMLVS